jgi:hypothetical protein
MASARRWRKVDGIQDMETKEFFAYPLPVTPLDIWDDSNYQVVVSVEKDDPAAWSLGGDHPVIEFKLRCALDGTTDLGRLLMRRAAQLGVSVEKLPNPFHDDDSLNYDRRVIAARIAIRKALWEPLLRLANVEEVDAPDELQVPTDMPLTGSDPHYYWSLYPKGTVPIAEVVSDSYLSKEARTRFNPREFAAFAKYRKLREATNRALTECAHVEGDLNEV